MHPLRSLLSSLCAVAMVAGTQAAPAQTTSPGDGPSVSYRVSIPNPASENFQVSGTLRNISRDTVTLHFPIWGPGAYDIVNFGAYVHDFTATSSTGRSLKVLRGDTNTFMIVGPDRQITISYQVHDIGSVPNSLWFGLSDIEKDFAFANTPALFGYPDGFKNVPYSVTYDPPKGWISPSGSTRPRRRTPSPRATTTSWSTRRCRWGNSRRPR